MLDVYVAMAGAYAATAVLFSLTTYEQAQYFLNGVYGDVIRTGSSLGLLTSLIPSVSLTVQFFVWWLWSRFAQH